MTQRSIAILLILFLFMLSVAGCSPPPRKRWLWPPFPETPRIEWLGTYASQEDFPQTGGQIFSEKILGKTDPEVFKSPFGIVSDSKGVVYISDPDDANLRVYDMLAQKVEYYTKNPIFSSPAGLAIDAADNLYVADPKAGAVLVFDKDRRPLRTLGSPQDFQVPAFVDIDKTRARIYVSDSRANKILIFDRFGNKSGEIGTQRKKDQGKDYVFSSPQGMAIDKEGKLYVAELLGAKISVFDVEGNFLRSFGERGDSIYQFEAPKDLAFDSDGNLWVVDARRAQIYTYTPEGTLLLATGAAQPSTHPLGFGAPTSIFIAADDSIYITDRFNRRFSVWRYLGSRAATLPPPVAP